MLSEHSILGYTSYYAQEANHHTKTKLSVTVQERQNQKATCILCMFSHGNPGIVKVHSKVIHKCKDQKVFIVHPQSVHVYEQLKELQRKKMFHSTLKTFLARNGQ